MTSTRVSGWYLQPRSDRNILKAVGYCYAKIRMWLERSWLNWNGTGIIQTLCHFFSKPNPNMRFLVIIVKNWHFHSKITIFIRKFQTKIWQTCNSGSFLKTTHFVDIILILNSEQIGMVPSESKQFGTKIRFRNEEFLESRNCIILSLIAFVSNKNHFLINFYGFHRVAFSIFVICFT